MQLQAQIDFKLELCDTIDTTQYCDKLKKLWISKRAIGILKKVTKQGEDT